MSLPVAYWLLQFLEWKAAGFLTQNGYRLLFCIMLDLSSDNIWSADYKRLAQYCDRVWGSIVTSVHKASLSIQQVCIGCDKNYQCLSQWLTGSFNLWMESC